MKNNICTGFFALIFLTSFCVKSQWQVTSPDGKIRATIQLNGSGEPTYSVDFIENTTTNIVSTSQLGLNRNDCDFRNGLTFNSLSSSAINETYEMVTGKQLSLQNNANELILRFTKCSVDFNIVFRAYNDGVAFRYQFPQTSATTYSVSDENSSVKVATNGKAWLQKNIENTPVYENFVSEVNIGESSPDYSGWCLPALLNPNNFWIMITEADLNKDYFGSHIAASAPNGEYRFEKPIFSDGTSYTNNAYFSTPMNSPWRVIMIGNKVKTIVESNLVSHLSSPAVINNTSWIKPAMSAWSWWSGWDSSQYPHKMRPHVDLASNLGYPYFAIDSNWDLISESEFADFRQYAQSKNVKLWLYYNSAGLHNGIDYFRPRDKIHTHALRQVEFQKLVDWGVVGIKVDFFQSDKQELIKLYLDILKDAADYGLMVNFHGCTIPRGWQRTYPNLMTMESVRGNEYMLISYGEDNPAHKVNLAFTRNIIGSMDATPGVVSYDYHGDPLPHLSTTSHQLALVSLFESGVVHLCDFHTKYRALPIMVQNVLSKMPTTWDETKFIEGMPNDYIVLARRKGNDWYISGINGKNTSRSINLNPTFIAQGDYTKQSIEDGATQSDLLINEITYQTGNQIAINMVAYGGFTVVLKEKCLNYKNITQNFNSNITTPFVAKELSSTSILMPAAKINFLASKSVLLNQGFQTQYGAVFKAEIGGCQ
jgi:alpha-glucosidase